MRGSWVVYGSFIIVFLLLVGVVVAGGWLVWMFCVGYRGALRSILLLGGGAGGKPPQAAS